MSCNEAAGAAGHSDRWVVFFVFWPLPVWKGSCRVWDGCYTTSEQNTEQQHQSGIHFPVFLHFQYGVHSHTLYNWCVYTSQLLPTSHAHTRAYTHTRTQFHMYKKHFAPMRTFSISWADNFTPDGRRDGMGSGELWLRWYMAERWARTCSLPEESRGRQNGPFCPCGGFTSRGGWWSFPAVLTDTKNTKTAHHSSLLSSQWFEMNLKDEMDDSDAGGFFFFFLFRGWDCVQVTSSGRSGEVRGRKARNERDTASTQRWGFASRWSHRRGCQRHRLTCQRRHHPDWDCDGLSGWRSCWLGHHAWSEPRQKQLNPLVSGAVGLFGHYPNWLIQLLLSMK